MIHAQKSVPRLVPFKNSPSKALPIPQKPDEKPAKQGKGTADIVFQKADPLYGGMGTPDRQGSLQPTKFHPSLNMFQGRYVILHHWKGKTEGEPAQVHPVEDRLLAADEEGVSRQQPSSQPAAVARKPADGDESHDDLDPDHGGDPERMSRE